MREIAYKNNEEKDNKVDILTLKENKKKINKILNRTTNVVEIDQYLEKVVQMNRFASMGYIE